MIEPPCFPANLRPNIHWINLTRLRPDWVSVGRTFHISPAAVIEVHDSVAKIGAETKTFVPAFFKKATDVFAKLTPPETTGQMIFAKAKLEIDGKPCGLDLGVHFDEQGECYLSAPYDWRQEKEN